MGFSGLEFIFLEVNNLEESLHFYSDQLGFTVDKFDLESEPPMARLRAGSFKLTLAQHLETMLTRGRGVNVFIGVDDVDRYHRELIAREVEIYPPADEGWGGRFITIQDPDKYRLFFVTWTPSKLDNQSHLTEAAI
jgi:predicted enzyme related to lactoylglutathione lyase